MGNIKNKNLVIILDYFLIKFSIFDNLKGKIMVFGMHVIDKSCITKDHVNKILKSLPAKWRRKLTTIQEATDLNKLGSESLISNMEFNHDEAKPKSKSIMLKSKGKNGQRSAG